MTLTPEQRATLLRAAEMLHREADIRLRSEADADGQWDDMGAQSEYDNINATARALRDMAEGE